MSEHEYEALGLVAGLEIHQQLDTETKLFCDCPTTLRDPGAAERRFTRYLHPTKSELGELDAAALEESRVDREFEYLSYNSTCLVEEDDEPPRRVDDEALTTTLEIAALLGMEPVDRAHVMRKLVIDGSNTAGFQRSMLVATDGVVETDDGPVGIEDIMLEEESAQRVTETSAGVRYSLDRLGIPLVEIGTRPDIHSPEQAREAAERIGMLLRSTRKVKRGLGTIRQDVNVSIAGGARVEIKGVQSLDDIDDIVRNEAERQVALLDIADRLEERDGAVGEPQDVSEVFANTDSGVVGGALADGGVVRAVPLFGFDGLVGRELLPDRRLGTEFADHAKRHGAGGIFHTDELPAYGVTADEVAAVRETVGAGPDDAVALVADDPETDVPPVEPDLGEIERPELLTEKVTRYTGLGLDRGLAEQVAYGERVGLFERAVEMGVDPTLAANTLESTVTELRRDGVPVERLDDEQFEESFELLVADELAKEGVPELLAALAADPGLSASEAAQQKGLGSADREAVRETVREVVEQNGEQVEAEGMGAFSALMGECMGALRGKADGDVVSDVLREEIQRHATADR